jgi:pyruvate-formate lyase-activating enzyme
MAKKTFKEKFELELESKSINKEHIIKLLKFTRPTLMSRLANPKTWTLGEVNKIDKKYKININQIV